MSEFNYTNYGAVTVSKNIINGNGILKWCVREDPKEDIDSGWIFMSDIDTEDFLADDDNWDIITFEDALAIEPTLLEIFNMPVGTELTLVKNKRKSYYFDTITGKKIK